MVPFMPQLPPLASCSEFSPLHLRSETLQSPFGPLAQAVWNVRCFYLCVQYGPVQGQEQADPFYSSFPSETQELIRFLAENCRRWSNQCTWHQVVPSLITPLFTLPFFLLLSAFPSLLFPGIEGSKKRAEWKATEGFALGSGFWGTHANKRTHKSFSSTPPFSFFPEILGKGLCKLPFPDCFASLLTVSANRKPGGQWEVEKTEAGRKDFFFSPLLSVFDSLATAVAVRAPRPPAPFAVPQTSRRCAERQLQRAGDSPSERPLLALAVPGLRNCSSSFTWGQSQGGSCFLQFLSQLCFRGFVWGLNESIHQHPILTMRGRFYKIVGTLN